VNWTVPFLRMDKLFGLTQALQVSFIFCFGLEKKFLICFLNLSISIEYVIFDENFRNSWQIRFVHFFVFLHSKLNF
jgi:hypothetical protein